MYFVARNAPCRLVCAERPTAVLSKPHLSSKAAKRRASRMFSSGSQVLYLYRHSQEERCLLPFIERIKCHATLLSKQSCCVRCNYRLRSGQWCVVNPAIAKASVDFIPAGWDSDIYNP